MQDPLTSSAVNVEGTLNVLLAARDEGRPPRRLLVVDVGLRLEPAAADAGGASRCDPISPYGVAKLAAERYCVSFCRVYESFETVVLRYFNVFGPRQSPFSQYAAACRSSSRAIAAGEPVTVNGDGEQSRDFTYVDNVVDATLRARRDAPASAARSSTSPPARPRRVNAVADTIGAILGKPVDKVHLPPRPGDIRDSWADLSKAQRLLGYAPDGRPRGRPAAHDRVSRRLGNG